MRLLTTTAWTVLALAVAQPAFADDVADVTQVEDLIVTGTRRVDRTAFESAAPVDVISESVLESTVSDELMEKLVAAVPSFNVQRLPAADGQAFVRPATLRGLSPDQTLVLINGKRRHRSALLGGRGAQGVDLGQIPSFALKRIEVLRDGASAQYGSDAIAGVINLILSDQPGVNAFAQASQYYEGDGRVLEGGVRAGWAIGDGGHLVATLTYTDSEATSRTRQRPDAIDFQAANPTLKVPNPVQRWGQPDRDATRLVVDAALPLSEAVELYGFATYSDSTGVTDFNWRNPSNDTSYRNSAAFPGWNLSQIYPVGFAPKFGQDETDYAVNVGLRGELGNGLSWDFNASLGEDKIDYFISETINASFGPQSPTAFRAGVLTQREQNLNLDFAKPLELSFLAEAANLAFGAERRVETYKIGAGDPMSYEVGPGAPAGLPSGSNGFPGYSSAQAGSWDQTSYAAYVDLDLSWTDAFSTDVAIRYEDFSEFGSTTDGKIAARYEISPNWAIRAAASTGFRAPTPGQLNSTRTSQGLDTTTLQLFTAGRLSPSNPVAQFFGAKPLEPETSKNVSVGLVYRNADHGLTASLDYYRVEVEDRFASSPSFSVTPAIRAQLIALGVPGADSLTSVSYFTNSFNTRTQGLDAVGSWKTAVGEGNLTLTAAYNWNDTKVTRSKLTEVSNLARINIEDGLPEHTGNVTALYAWGRFEGMARVRYFGDWTDAQFQSSADLVQTFGARAFLDLSLSAQVTDQVKITVGAENLFDTYPDEATFQASRGLIYSRNAVYDTDGGLYYVRVGAKF
ncbi:TonB-dependent receptor [Phenylobacterium sp.]|uniref:TonB-dependent receptor plug domain-containing protein n=1 Tax=Phenylobacterium sp. TaxID=1871053 RepID=UPI0028A0ED2A|nr:TonB-dependent receptor [Phenylobacterium sp.]